jgi:hypothetical protein
LLLSDRDDTGVLERGIPARASAEQVRQCKMDKPTHISFISPFSGRNNKGQPNMHKVAF